MQVVIGPDGVLEFEMKPGWVYEIEAKAKGYGLEKYVVQGQTGQDLVLDKASDLTGRVLDKTTGLPLAGARVVFENGFETYEARTDADGRYRFEGVGARSAQVFVSDNAHVAVGQPIDFLRPGEASQFDVFVNEGMHLGGQVLIAGSQLPASNMQVELLDRLTQQVVSTGFTDGAGRFSFQLAQPVPGLRRERFRSRLQRGQLSADLQFERFDHAHRDSHLDVDGRSAVGRRRRPGRPDPPHASGRAAAPGVRKPDERGRARPTSRALPHSASSRASSRTGSSSTTSTTPRWS